MSETTEVSNATENATQADLWAEAAAASAEAQQPDQEIEFVDDVLTVTLTNDDIVKMAVENEARIKQRDDLENQLEAEKETVKGTKSAIDALQRRIDECGRSMGTKKANLKKKWKVITIFPTNTVEWRDPDTDAVVLETAIPPARLQQDLFDNSHVSSDTGSENSDGNDTEINALEIVDVAGTPDSTTNLHGDPDDAEAGSAPPAQPSRRGRKEK